MVSARAFPGIVFPDSVHRHPHAAASFPSAPLSRRDALLICAAPLNLAAFTPASLARERRARKSIAIEDYKETCHTIVLRECSERYGRRLSAEGLKYYDLAEGKGPIAERGAVVQVHFDCIYRGVTAVSSRESKLLAGNRAIAQPYEFKVGSPPGKERKRDFIDNANGLYSAQAAPRPPPALYSITEGMRVGGKRTVIVPPRFGYGNEGLNEIPPGATFDLNLELLEVIKRT